MYWITYILVPIVCGALAVSGFLFPKGQEPVAQARGLAPYKGLIGVGMLACGVVNAIELSEIASELNGVGKVLFLSILAAQLGVGLLAAVACVGAALPSAVAVGPALGRRLGAIEVRLGFLAIATGVAMLLVRGRILKIF